MKNVLIHPRLLLSLILFSLFLLVFDSIKWLNMPKSLIQQITIPIEYGLYQSGMYWQKQFEFIFITRQAFSENKALKEQMAAVLMENADLRTRLKETESLVDQYNKLNPQTYDLLPARVIGTGRFLTIDRGSNDNISIGQAVVFKDHYLGEVREVSPKTAWILLPSDPDSRIAVFSQSQEGRARGILEGQFGSELLMNKILHQEAIKMEDIVYSEGTEGKLPRGLVVGRVSEVYNRENEIFKQAKVEPIYRAIDLDVVFILRSS